MATSTRELRERLGPKQKAANEGPGDDLGLAFLLLWVVSIARVVRAFSLHEAFGTISTLALISIVFLPALIWREMKG